MVELAKKKAQQLGVVKNSITRGEGNLAGFLGEIMAESVIPTATIKNTPHYDLVYEDGSTADVKTKRCTSDPLPHYECSVADFNPFQECDKYIFVRVMKNLSKGWILGELPKNDYFGKARFMEKGQYDPRNDWYCKGDCWNVEIKELNPIML